MVCQDCRTSAVAGALQRGRSCVGHLRGLISCGEEVLIRTAPSPGSWQLRGAKLLLEKRGELCSCGFVVQLHPWKHDSTGCDGQRWVTWGLLWQKLYVREKRSKRRWRWAWWWAGKGRGLLVWACLVAWCLAMRRNGLAGQPDEDSLGKLCSSQFPSVDELGFLEGWSLILFVAAGGWLVFFCERVLQVQFSAVLRVA